MLFSERVVNLRERFFERQNGRCRVADAMHAAGVELHPESAITGAALEDDGAAGALLLPDDEGLEELEKDGVLFEGFLQALGEKLFGVGFCSVAAGALQMGDGIGQRLSICVSSSELRVEALNRLVEPRVLLQHGL